MYCLCGIMVCAPLTCSAHGRKHDAHNGLLPKKECCLSAAWSQWSVCFSATVETSAVQFFASLTGWGCGSDESCRNWSTPLQTHKGGSKKKSHCALAS